MHVSARSQPRACAVFFAVGIFGAGPDVRPEFPAVYCEITRAASGEAWREMPESPGPYRESATGGYVSGSRTFEHEPGAAVSPCHYFLTTTGKN